MSPFGPVCPILKRARHLSLVIHQRPDGDAIGSAIALVHAFSANQTRVEVVCATEIAEIFTRVLGPITTKRIIAPDTDVIVLLDCAQLHRTGVDDQLKTARQQGKTVIAFDHHVQGSISRFVDATVHIAEASSTAEILYDCLTDLRVPITSQIADGLLLGIYTDTGGFRHANTSSKTLKTVSRLISHGANLERLRQLFSQQRTLAKTRLWGAVYSQVSINKFGLAVARIDAATLINSGASPEDAAGLANHLALLREARAALVLIETDKGWKATLRTRHPHIDLRRLARYFGGRGTQKATGFLATRELITGMKKPGTPVTSPTRSGKIN